MTRRAWLLCAVLSACTTKPPEPPPTECVLAVNLYTGLLNEKGVYDPEYKDTRFDEILKIAETMQKHPDKQCIAAQTFAEQIRTARAKARAAVPLEIEDPNSPGGASAAKATVTAEAKQKQAEWTRSVATCQAACEKGVNACLSAVGCKAPFAEDPDVGVRPGGQVAVTCSSTDTKPVAMCQTVFSECNKACTPATPVLGKDYQILAPKVKPSK